MHMDDEDDDDVDDEMIDFDIFDNRIRLFLLTERVSEDYSITREIFNQLQRQQRLQHQQQRRR